MCRGFISATGGVKCGCGKVKWGLQEGGVRGGRKCVPSAIGCGPKCLIMQLIVPLLCQRYKYTPVGPQGDSLDTLAPVDTTAHQTQQHTL